MATRFMRKQLIRMGRLLDMMYRPSEVAEEIEMTTATIYRACLPDGAPFTRDKGGDIWIHGKSFAAWALELQKKRHPGRLADGEAWCFNCKGPVVMLKPRRKHLGRYTAIYQGRCTVCGQVVNRAYAASWRPGAAQLEVEDMNTGEAPKTSPGPYQTTQEAYRD